MSCDAHWPTPRSARVQVVHQLRVRRSCARRTSCCARMAILYQPGVSPLSCAPAVAIALHNIPEGVCVAMPIFYATGSKWKVGHAGWTPPSPMHKIGVVQPAHQRSGSLKVQCNLHDITHSYCIVTCAGLLVGLPLRCLRAHWRPGGLPGPQRQQRPRLCHRVWPGGRHDGLHRHQGAGGQLLYNCCCVCCRTAVGLLGCAQVAAHCWAVHTHPVRNATTAASPHPLVHRS